MPFDLEAVNRFKKPATDFSSALFQAIGTYNSCMFYGNDHVRRAVDSIEGMMAYYRVIVKEFDYDKKKQKILNDYNKKIQDLKKEPKTEQKEYDNAEYNYLRAKFSLLMELIGYSGLLPARDIIEEQA